MPNWTCSSNHTKAPSACGGDFYSYLHKDEKLCAKLENHLAILRREGLIETWHDRKIGPGTEWAGAIDEHLNEADIILLLVSSDFLASDYCSDVEVVRAMERHKAGEACVIPVILRPCDWGHTPFAKLQALPKDGVDQTGASIDHVIARLKKTQPQEDFAHIFGGTIEALTWEQKIVLSTLTLSGCPVSREALQWITELEEDVLSLAFEDFERDRAMTDHAVRFGLVVHARH